LAGQTLALKPAQPDCQYCGGLVAFLTFAKIAKKNTLLINCDTNVQLIGSLL